MEEINGLMPEGNPIEYTEDNIRHLDDMEHIRVRSGMYIGRLGDGAQNDDGIYVLLKEVMDNSIDEFKMGAGKRIEVIIEETQGGIVENTIVEEAPVTMNFALSNQVVVSFELDNAADGQYVGESTRIELDANTKIYLRKVPDFTPSGAKEFTGWTLNGQPLTGYANPFMYLMNNMTITENLVFKPVFGSATKYRIQLGIKELNTGWLTGQVTFYYSTDIQTFIYFQF